MIHQAPGIRTFIALPSSTQFKDALRKLQSSLIEERADVKWDSPDKFHITLKFLGNVVAEKIAEVWIGTLSVCVVTCPVVGSRINEGAAFVGVALFPVATEYW